MKKGTIAILVDSAKQTIKCVTIDTYKDIYKHIGNECECFDVPVEFENNDALYCDDEGLYHPFQGGIIMRGWDRPIVGNVLIIGTDEEGESVDCKSDIFAIEKNIKFLNINEIELFSLKPTINFSLN